MFAAVTIIHLFDHTVFEGKTILSFFNLNNYSYIHLLASLPALIVLGIYCKKVTETEDSFIVSFLYGLRRKVFLKNELFTKYSDSTLINPAEPFIVSNEHIKLEDKEKESIIYPMGTFKFEKLKIKLQKLKEENKQVHSD